MQVKTWLGVANGEDFTREQKAQMRAGKTLPEDVELRMAELIGGVEIMPGVTFADAWRGAVVDVEASNGDAQFSMTHEQAAMWKAVRDS